jgi:hypothetical protein
VARLDAVAPPLAGRGVRSRDLAGTQFKWTDLKIVHEFADDSPYKGHAVAYVDHPDDLGALGKAMGHCAGTHFVWACEERIWGFFTIITTKDKQPHTTLHAKQLKWVGKNHPRDTAPNPYANRLGGYITCEECKGYGGHREDGTPYYYREIGVKTCSKCKGVGAYLLPVKAEKGETPVPVPQSSFGMYPTFADVVAAFESVGRKYEAGKWAPLNFDSRTYEIGRGYKEPILNFDSQFGRFTLKSCPAGIDKETWATYEKTIAAMKAQFDQSNGSVQIVGRTFKFDGKEWYVLSFSGRGDSYLANNTTYRGMMHEFFVESNKRKKVTDAK